MAPRRISLGYDVQELRDGWAVVEVYADGFETIIERGFDYPAAAEHYAEELAQQGRDEAFEITDAAAAYGAFDVRRAA